VYAVVAVVLVIVLLVGGWWLLWRALNADQTPEPGGSFGDLALGEKNTRKARKKQKRGEPVE
jgi:hypothetical protein